MTRMFPPGHARGLAAEARPAAWAQCRHIAADRSIGGAHHDGCIPVGGGLHVRRNVALVVAARGSLAEEALGLARRLDGLVERQPPRTLEQLRELLAASAEAEVGGR